jgi:nudix-type nucleoside diphosphatase (YffH/AdpP family)
MAEVKVLSREKVLKQFFNVEEVKLQMQGSDEPVQRFVVIPKKAVAILVYNPEKDTVILSKQWRIGAINEKDQYVLEIPAGVRDEDEEPEEAGKREVMEEVGYRVDKLVPISNIFTSPGYTTERIAMYYAEISEKHKEQDGGGLADEHEHIDIIELPLEQSLKMIATGEITDAKTIVALYWLKLRLI